MIKTILIAENSIQRKALKSMLSKDPVDFLVDVCKAEEISCLEVWQKAELVIGIGVDRTFVPILNQLKQQDSFTTPFIFIVNGNDSFGIAVDLMKAGAYYCLSQPFDIDKLKKLILEIRQKIRKEATWKENRSLVYVRGSSSLANIMHQNVSLVSPTNYNVLLTGESGTGKESIARMVHDKSNRSGKPFVAIDCGSLTSELAASELFGHEKGAFTGAIATKTGAFEAAGGGTLFLDEISNLSLELQALLLRAIQEKAIRTVGSAKEKSIDVRMIAATNCSLPSLIKDNRFRQDLYYRINEFSITLPALRQRGEDIIQIANTFKDITSIELNKPLGNFSGEVVDVFYKYHWPGNIRELKNVIRRMCLLSGPNKDLDVTLLPEEVRSNWGLTSLDDKYENGLKETIQKAEMDRIWDVLKSCNNNKTKAAKILNITRKTLYNKLRANN